jgi:hypothetical protein
MAEWKLANSRIRSGKKQNGNWQIAGLEVANGIMEIGK